MINTHKIPKKKKLSDFISKNHLLLSLLFLGYYIPNDRDIPHIVYPSTALQQKKVALHSHKRTRQFHEA